MSNDETKHQSDSDSECSELPSLEPPKLVRQTGKQNLAVPEVEETDQTVWKNRVRLLQDTVKQNEAHYQRSLTDLEKTYKQVVSDLSDKVAVASHCKSCRSSINKMGRGNVSTITNKKIHVLEERVALLTFQLEKTTDVYSELMTTMEYEHKAFREAQSTLDKAVDKIEIERRISVNEEEIKDREKEIQSEKRAKEKVERVQQMVDGISPNLPLGTSRLPKRRETKKVSTRKRQTKKSE